MTSISQEAAYLRRLVLRMWWDGKTTPSGKVPLGVVFGVGHAQTVTFASLLVQ